MTNLRPFLTLFFATFFIWAAICSVVEHKASIDLVPRTFARVLASLESPPIPANTIYLRKRLKPYNLPRRSKVLPLWPSAVLLRHGGRLLTRWDMRPHLLGVSGTLQTRAEMLPWQLRDSRCYHFLPLRLRAVPPWGVLQGESL
ncbi:uncharacterized protein K441DRAFT_151731 [Cenococcum geophilum 1.58]|uniref:uncharacterized protein n=1 Tax=Cenococcum geophilum 1.58 TaxID=794803 RepID=UPI00358F4DDB|nr:hypothetical protein K441DRAFT_151731 [Cenococcum geophilum 1.58]